MQFEYSIDLFQLFVSISVLALSWYKYTSGSFEISGCQYYLQNTQCCNNQDDCDKARRIANSYFDALIINMISTWLFLVFSIASCKHEKFKSWAKTLFLIGTLLSLITMIVATQAIRIADRSQICTLMITITSIWSFQCLTYIILFVRKYFQGEKQEHTAIQSQTTFVAPQTPVPKLYTICIQSPPGNE